MNTINTIIERSIGVMEGNYLPERQNKFQVYAMSNFRGGIGKSTLSFNLAFELSKNYNTLLLDTCSQRNLSQNIFGESLQDINKTIYDSLISRITNTSTIDVDDLILPAKSDCTSFRKNKACYMIPGSSKLFLFPSILYSQLAQYGTLDNQYKTESSAKVLLLIDSIIKDIIQVKKSEKVLIDTSPFFGGATHLAWCGSEALIIPVRVDQHSIEALDLTLQMLSKEDMDFQKFNRQADLKRIPKVHAIAMTHCGWSRQKANTPDSSTQFFVQKALEIANKFPELFSENDISKCFYLFDDFHASGCISGNRRIPISELKAQSEYVVDGKRMKVNIAVERYKKQIQNLASAM